ncbi:MAG: hypothetical protein ACT4OS_10635, partial [Acidimicrobiales bacterium]
STVPFDLLGPRAATVRVGPPSPRGRGAGGRPPVGGPAADGATRPDDGARASTGFGKMTFDLTRMAELAGDAQLAMVARYLGSIQIRRQDFNGRVLTVRGDDIRAMAALFGVEPDLLIRRLDGLRLRAAQPGFRP